MWTLSDLGFEEGAEGGAGWGIDTFRPAKRPYKLSENMCIPQVALDRIIGNDRLSDLKAETSVAVIKDQLAITENEYRLWDDNENPIVYSDEPKVHGSAGSTLIVCSLWL